MYNLRSYGNMILDRIRVEAYLEAMRRTITPGCVVVEIGAGAGFFAMQACRMGAGRVYAIEPSSVVTIAESAARANGFGDRIVFAQAMSQEVELPEPGDILLSDLRGVLPLHQAHVPTIIDARKRLIKPGAPQIPGRDRIHAALVRSCAAADEPFAAWTTESDGFTYSAALQAMANTWWKARFESDDLLSDARLLAELDYRTVSDPGLRATASFAARHAGEAAGFVVWFDTELIDGVGFSNTPGAPEAIYGSAYFPFLGPIRVEEGEVVSIDLRADWIRQEYTWTWRTRGPAGQEYLQSTFHASMINPKTFQKTAAAYRPELSQSGMETAFVTGRMDGVRSNIELARELMEAFPARFASEQDALNRVTAITVRYSG